MRSFLKIKNDIYKKKFLFRMLIIYSVFTFVVMVTLSYILIGNSSKSLQEEIYNSNNSLLAQVQIFSDTYLVGKIYSMINEKLLEIPDDSNISSFFSPSLQNNVSVMYRVYQNISNMQCKSDARYGDFIESIYLYRKSDDTIISSREGLCLSASSPGSSAKNIVNTELVKKTIVSTKNNSWISPLENRSFYANQSIISFTQSIPMLSTPSDRLGCIVINIDAEDFFKSINKMPNTIDGDLMVIDSNGRLFAHSNFHKIYENRKMENYINDIMNLDTGIKTCTIDNQLTCVSWVRSTLIDWKYVSIVPVETLNKKLLAARRYALLITGLIALLSFLSLYIITFHMYKPVKSMIRNIIDRYNIQGSCDELTCINSIITNLSSKVEEMESTIHTNRGLIEYRTAMDIIYGNAADAVEIKKKLQLIGKDFSCSKYCLILTEVKNSMLARLPLEQREYVTYKMVDIINSHFYEKCCCISICHPSNCIITVANFNDQELVSDGIDSLIHMLEQDLGLVFNIAVSRSIDELIELDEVYKATIGYHKYSFIYAYGNVFTYETIEKYESSNGNFALIVPEEDLRSLLRLCRTEQLKEEIAKIISTIKIGGYSYNYIQSVLQQIVILLCNTSNEQNIDCTVLSKNRVLDEFNSIESIDEFKNWLFKLIDIYEENIGIRNTYIDQDFIIKITQYISCNIASQISLNMVAEVFNISPSYLSRVFKAGTGNTFSDFVSKKKFEKAVELLVTNRKMSVAEIAEKLGYFNISYFTKLFKERYGMTPVQMRKKSFNMNH